MQLLTKYEMNVLINMLNQNLIKWEDIPNELSRIRMELSIKKG